MTKLEETGFIIRTTNAKDKRTYDICPTQKAWQVYPSVKEQVDICFQRMTQQMTDTQRAEFKRLLLLAAETTLSLDEY